MQMFGCQKRLTLIFAFTLRFNSSLACRQVTRN